MEDNAKKPVTSVEAPPKPPAPLPEERTPRPVPPELSPQDQARERAHHCGREIEAVLAKHRCQIVPFIVPQLERVGEHGSKALVAASFGIVPQE